MQLSFTFFPIRLRSRDYNYEELKSKIANITMTLSTLKPTKFGLELKLDLAP